MNDTALKLAEVRKNFGRTAIINGVNLEIGRGERHAIIGPNGAGKSTLFNLISGRYPVSSGRIELKGEDITNLEPHVINRKGLSRSFHLRGTRILRDGRRRDAQSKTDEREALTIEEIH